MKVLQLDKDCYYVHPTSEFSQFGTVGVPYLATEFSENIKVFPTEVFKDAKFIEIEVRWKIKE
jgi:hypothetical protein